MIETVPQVTVSLAESADWMDEVSSQRDALSPLGSRDFSEILPEYFEAEEIARIEEEEAQSVLAMLLSPPYQEAGNKLPPDLPPKTSDEKKAGAEDSPQIMTLLAELAAAQQFARVNPEDAAALRAKTDLADIKALPEAVVIPGVEMDLTDAKLLPETSVATDADLSSAGQLSIAIDQSEAGPNAGGKADPIPMPGYSTEPHGGEELMNSQEHTPSVGRTYELTGGPWLGFQKLEGAPSLIGQAPGLSPLQSIASQQIVPTIFRIEMPIHDEKWGQIFVSRVAWQIAENIQEAQIHVNPPELGPVEVSVRVSEDQATVHFHTQHGHARETIERAIPELREVLSQSGLHLADANVSQGSSGYEREHTGRLAPPMSEVSGDGITKHEEFAPLSETHQQAGLIDAYV